MGILNVTPDSFSDGGRYVDIGLAVRHALQMVEEGAAMIDVGGESTRPGAAAVSAQEEIDRVVPVIEAHRGAVRRHRLRRHQQSRGDSSGDSRRRQHDQRRAGAAGAGCTRRGRCTDAAVCLMHMQGEPRTMQLEPHYDDVVGEVREFLLARVEACVAAGIARDRLIVDPGIGFGKRLEHNLALLAARADSRATAAAGADRRVAEIDVRLVARQAGRRTAGGGRGHRDRLRCWPAPASFALTMWRRLSTRSKSPRRCERQVMRYLPDRLNTARRTIVGRKYFGTDGVRGRVGEHPLTVEFALKLASAAARVLAPKGGTVLVGKDTRLSGYMFESALEAGFVASGVNVMLIGPLPTPGIAYLTKRFECDFGVVISASHNPYEDNGIKFFDASGGKLSDDDRGAHRAASRRAAGDAHFERARPRDARRQDRACAIRSSARRRCRAWTSPASRS